MRQPIVYLPGKSWELTRTTMRATSCSSSSSNLIVFSYDLPRSRQAALRHTHFQHFSHHWGYTEWPTNISDIADRPRFRVLWLWPKVEDWNWETIFTDISSLSLTTDVIGQQSDQILWKIRAIMPFKVIQGHRGRYQSKARIRLPISD